MNVELNFNTVVAFAFILFATFMILRAVWNITAAIESRNWPQANGVILSSRIEKSRDSEGGELTKAAVTYRFQTNGQEFIGRRACFGDATATNIPFLARRIAHRYRVGQAVVVRYNPRKTEDCVLEPGMNSSLAFDIAFGCLFLAIAILALRSAAA